MSDIPCSVDNFAVSLESVLGGVFNECDEKVGKAVQRSVRYGAKQLREKHAVAGKHEWSDRYRNGFTSRTTRGKGKTTGEIGNKNEPGLVHLLEKGHATLTGRRTNAYPHMAPAFDELQEYFSEQVGIAVDKALKG